MNIGNLTQKVGVLVAFMWLMPFSVFGAGPNSGFRIQGTISQAGSTAPLAGVTLTLSGRTLGSTVTDSSGFYAFNPLWRGPHTVTPRKADCVFSPISRQIKIRGSIIANFTATCTNTKPIIYKPHGFSAGIYVDGQDPNRGDKVSVQQLRQQMSVFTAYTSWVRTFGTENGLENAGMVARSLGLKTAIGAWLGRDLLANERQIANLIRMGNAGDVDVAIVGSEALLRNDLTEAQLVAYINRVKQALPGIPVTTGDTYHSLLSHPAVFQAVDLVFANYYPYWEGIALENSIAALHHWHQQVVAASGGKPVYVGETGWPSCGNTIGNAVPSPSNAASYFLNFASWARANNVPHFYFESTDEPWKAQYEGGPQGACWGVWTKDGVLKPGMQDVFDGKTIADNWTVPGGTGQPEVTLTFVPKYGTFDNLRGRVLHVNPADHKLAVYIKVGNGWWTKPTFATPTTPIQWDGGFTTDITTGGTDQLATAIAVYLVKSSFSPPLSGGQSSLPAALDQNAVAKVTVTRTP